MPFEYAASRMVVAKKYKGILGYMADKPLKFSGNQLVVNGQEVFDISSFDQIHDSDTEHMDIKVSEQVTETISIKKTSKEVKEGRFVCLYFNYGNKYPYAKTVAKVEGDDLKELDNPRTPDLIELDDQLFVLIDTELQRIWLSNQRQRNEIAKWLKEKIGKDIYIKSIIKETDFIEKLRSIQEISFTVLPDLFNSADQESLSAHLVQDIFGFGAEKARVQLFYRNSNITDTIKEKFNGLIAKKENFQEVVVIGRSDEGFDTVFNLDEVVSKISVSVGSDETSKLLDPNLVFDAIIAKIKSHGS